jgi:hypothetical protein
MYVKMLEQLDYMAWQYGDLINFLLLLNRRKQTQR